jgi:competence CoiA-like predicted nuclease
VTYKSNRGKSQSFEQMRMKLYFYENIPVSNNVRSKIEEYKLGDQIIDVYVELANGNKIAIEIQHSKISASSLIERTLKYSQRCINVLWTLDGKSFNRRLQNQEGIRISELEFVLHKLYNERVYYLNVESTELSSGVYSLSYVPYFNIKDIIYKKKSLSKRSVYYQQIQNLKLKCISHKYKLAMFEDVSIRSLCEQEIYQFLKYCCKERDMQRLRRKNGVLIIPVANIVSFLEKKYGFYLVYDVLKNSKSEDRKLKIARMGFMKDKENEIRECVKIYLTDYL